MHSESQAFLRSGISKDNGTRSAFEKFSPNIFEKNNFQYYQSQIREKSLVLLSK